MTGDLPECVDAVNSSWHVLLVVHVCSFWMKDLKTKSCDQYNQINDTTINAVMCSLTVGSPSAVKAFLQWLMLSVWRNWRPTACTDQYTADYWLLTHSWFLKLLRVVLCCVVVSCDLVSLLLGVIDLLQGDDVGSESMTQFSKNDSVPQRLLQLSGCRKLLLQTRLHPPEQVRKKGERHWHLSSVPVVNRCFRHDNRTLRLSYHGYSG